MASSSEQGSGKRLEPRGFVMARRGASKVGLTLGVALSLVAGAPARAADLGYGGRVVDEAGAPLAGPVDVTLRFFDAPTGGSQLGNALSFKAVALVDGNFQLTLGLSDAQQSEIFDDGSHTVYVEVEAATKVYPRQKFLAVPVALRVPVDNATLEFASDSKLTIKQVSMSQVVGLSDALAANSSTTAASASESGYLSAADWTRFDAKQAAIDETMTVTAGGLTTAQQSALLVKPYGTAANETGELRFEERTGGNYVALRAPDAVAADLVYTLPGADGAPGQFLSTDGSGMLAWTSPASGGDMMASANLSDLADSAAARSNLGLGALATASAVGSAQITDDTIANADISGTAAIATSKLAGAVTSISGHGLGALATMSTVGSSEIANGAIADADVSGTAAIATSKLSGAITSISGHGLGSLATLSAVDGTSISDGSIADADISSSAAIATSKLSGAVTSIPGHGLGSLATLSAIDSSNISDGAITDADVSGTAAISSTKISFVADSISGNAIDGGTISNFASTGIDDNASAVALTVGSSGNVGIGTTAPVSKLHISGSLLIPGFENASNVISFREGIPDGTNVGIRAKAIATANRDGLELMGHNGLDFSINNAGTVAMRVAADGNVGIGTTAPAGLLDVNGKLTVLSSGNVGIGTASPAYPLQVAGTVHSTSGGFRFPDGTSMSSAGASANVGSLAVKLGKSSAFLSSPGGTNLRHYDWEGFAVNNVNLTNATNASCGSNSRIVCAKPGDSITVAYNYSRTANHWCTGCAFYTSVDFVRYGDDGSTGSYGRINCHSGSALVFAETAKSATWVVPAGATPGVYFIQHQSYADFSCTGYATGMGSSAVGIVNVYN